MIYLFIFSSIYELNGVKDALIEARAGSGIASVNNGLLNPAGITYLNRTIGFTHQIYYDFIQRGNIFYSYKAGSFSFSFPLQYLYTEMEKTGPNNEKLGRFSYLFLAPGICVASHIKSINMGLGINPFIRTSSGNASFGIVLNAGLIYSTPIDSLLLGLSANNIGYEIKPFLEERSIPDIYATLGVKYSGIEKFVFFLDFETGIENITFHTGGEYHFSFIYFVMGYQTGMESLKEEGPLDPLSGFSFGLGTKKIKNLRINYAVTPSLILGTQHTVSIFFELWKKDSL